MVNRADIFPSAHLREELSRIGVPEAQHNIHCLEEMMPIPLLMKRGQIFFADDIAQMLIDMVGKGIIRLPQPLDQAIDNLKPGTHSCQLYGSHQDFVRLMVAFYNKGLVNNEQCVFVASERFSLFEAHKIFSEGIVGFNEHLKAGRIEIISYKDYYLDATGELKEPCDLIQYPAIKEEEALSKGFSGLRGAADLSWLRQRDWAKFMEYEGLIDTVVQESRITALCVYSLEAFKADEITSAARSHQVVYSKRNQWCHQIEKSEHTDAFLRSLKEVYV